MAIYDQYGNVVDLTKLRQEQAGPSMSGVRNPIGNFPSVGLTPERLASILREAVDGDTSRYLELAEEMEEKDLHYLAVIATRKRAVAQLEMTVDPADDSAEAEKDAELIRELLARDCLQEEIFDIMDAVGKGFSMTEIVWETSEKSWMPCELKWRDQRWFEFDRHDRRTVYLKTDDGPQPLNPYSWIQCEIKAKSGLPIRGGLARAAAWAYVFKNFDIKNWVQFAEIYGQPIRVGKYGPEANEDDKRKLLRAVANISTDAAAIIPSSMELEFVKAEQKGSSDLFIVLANFMDQQISKAVLGQTTTTDAISGGHAVSKEHNEVREDIETSDATQLAAVLNRDLVRPTVDLNHGPRKTYPRIRIGRAQQTDITVFTEGLARVVPLGLKVSQTEVLAKMGLNPPESEDDVLGVTPALAKETPPDDVAEDDTATAASQSRKPDAFEEFIASMADAGELGDLTDPLFEPLQKAFDQAHSFEELKALLTSHIKDMDPDDLAESMARATFAARLAGETGADVGPTDAD